MTSATLQKSTAEQPTAKILQLTAPKDAGDNPNESARTQAEKFLKEKEAQDVLAMIEKENETFAIVTVGNKTYVMQRCTDPETGYWKLLYLDKNSYKLLRANQFVHVGGRRRTLADVWLTHPNRREYAGTVLLPGETTPPGYYNLWSGFHIEPHPGDPSLALRHIHHVICGGNKQQTAYLLRWLARCVQQPGLPAEVAIVLRGGRGTGKSTLGRWMAQIFGAHGLHITRASHLIGKFNAHLAQCLFLFSDEAFFVGDRAGGDVLKGLITEPTLTIEAKGIDVGVRQNRLKIMMATNHEWAVPAGTDERRFFVLDVNDCHQQDHDYFRKLNAHMEGGGLSALLHFLVNKVSIAEFNVRAVPNTRALTDQKLLSLPLVLRWLYERLWAAELVQHDGGWKTEQLRDVIVREYAEYVRANGQGRYVSTDASSIGKALRKVLLLGEKQMSSGKRPRAWVFPELADARRAFEVKVLSGESGDWPKDAPE